MLYTFLYMSNEIDQYLFESLSIYDLYYTIEVIK